VFRFDIAAKRRKKHKNRNSGFLQIHQVSAIKNFNNNLLFPFYPDLGPIIFLHFVAIFPVYPG